MLTKRFDTLFVVTAVVLCLYPFAAAGSRGSTDGAAEKRPDILVIDVPRTQGRQEMPKVRFKHELHSNAVEGQCAECHEKKGNTTVFKFQRTEDADGIEFMDFYHDRCTACHGQMKADGRSGPLGGQCRECHNARFATGSSRTLPAFDRPLHFRHESAGAIPSTIKGIDTNCNACHHSATEKNNAIFYEQGDESACAYCHKETQIKGVRSLRHAAHDSCVACHLAVGKADQKAGPVQCSGCHDASALARIEKPADVPRLKRNQPDAVLLTGWTALGNSEKESKKIVAGHMDPVPFNHKSHETRNESCKACHHESLRKCNDCHTAAGDAKGGSVKLAEAMHAANARQSCIGCHNELKKAKDCAGCHSQMPDKAFEDTNCKTCHSVDAKAQSPVILKIEKAAAALAKEALDTDGYARVDLEKVPETVSIDVIAKDFEPSRFPHRMVVAAVFKKAGENDMANAFHKTDLTLCTGCHHHSPASMTPPRCAACHGEAPDPLTGKPGLKGAYHGQCITCHQKMEVASVRPTDCTKCHEKK